MLFNTIDMVQIAQFEKLSGMNGIYHCISTRNTGMSTGAFASLNLGCTTGDNKTHVNENRKEFFNALNISEDMVAKPVQIHSNNIMRITNAGTYENCDGLITDKKGIVLSIQTADCIPLFLVSSEPECIGLIHAGWRGVANDIVRKSVSFMAKEFGMVPENLSAFIGPGIRKCCYEIKEDVACYFPDNYLIGNHLNLVHCISDQLIERGLDPENIEDCKLCTSCKTNYFYSYRKSKGVTGRMMSILMLK